MSEVVRVAVDAMGGDNAPGEIIKGAVCALKANENLDLTLVGKEELVNEELSKYPDVPKERCRVLNATEIIEMAEPPVAAITKKKDSSIVKGMKLVHEGSCDAFFTAGSSGATLVGGQLIVGRIKGIERPPFAPVMPTQKGPCLLLDCGANVDPKPSMLVQFAQMGSIYMERIIGVKNPRVALFNIGAEETKGRALELEAYRLLSESGLNFVGNIEARDLPKGEVQVVVTDGFTGNVALKLYEGMGAFFGAKMKWIFSGTGKIGALFALGKIKKFRRQMDYKETGGSALLGVRRPVIKAHGSSDGLAFFNAVRQAEKCVKADVSGVIENYVAKLEIPGKE